MKLKLITIVILLLPLTQTCIAQTKNEKEERINASDFPEVAQNVINALPQNCKRIKFYKETDGKKQSYEAKFKHKKRRFSLEFSKDGIIEDLEVATKLKHIKEEPKTQIKNYLVKTFDKHKIIKIQKQYVFKNTINGNTFVEDILLMQSEIAPNFEIIAEVREKSKRDIREFTFGPKGEFLNFRVLNPSSYEHVLY